MINAILNHPPEYNETGLKGFPINAILDFPMGTPAGLAAFSNPKFNIAIKAVLDKWGTYLKSPESCGTLNDSPTGWFGLDSHGDEKMPNFDQTFICDPTKPHKGFTSWDDFFTRRFRPGLRPIASPDDDDVICNACESSPYRLEYNVSYHARFWIKAQPYSLEYLLDVGRDVSGEDNDGGSDGERGIAERFIGGTIYQVIAHDSSLPTHHNYCTLFIFPHKCSPASSPPSPLFIHVYYLHIYICTIYIYIVYIDRLFSQLQPITDGTPQSTELSIRSVTYLARTTRSAPSKWMMKMHPITVKPSLLKLLLAYWSILLPITLISD
jgi:phosphatidylserine decarboxylase